MGSKDIVKYSFEMECAETGCGIGRKDVEFTMKNVENERGSMLARK